MGAKKQHSLQRRSYATTRAFIRSLRARSESPRTIRIFTNVQNSSVAGISRVMSSFVEHAQSSTHAKVEMVCVSVAEPKNEERPVWEANRALRGKIATLLYTGEMPLLGPVLEHARGMQDIRRAFAPFIKALVEQLRATTPDIVLINGTYNVPWCLMLAARQLGLPIVVHYHGSITKETEHWQEERKKRLLRHMEMSFYDRSARYVFPSQLIKKYVEREIFARALPSQRALVLPNPIPEEFFGTPMHRPGSGIGFVGRWTRVKNTTFLARFAKANTERGSYPVYVVTDKNSKRKAAKILREHALFVGPFLRAETLANLYAKLRVIICPSYFETYGNVAQEAVAAGTAALVSRNMGVAEVFEEIGLSRLIVNFEKMSEVFDAIRDRRRLTITKTERDALHKKAGAKVVHEQLLQYMRYVQLHSRAHAAAPERT